MAAIQSKKHATSKEASHYYSNKSISIPCKKRVSTGVIPSHKTKGEKTPKYHRIQHYCVICKRVGMSERNYMPNISEKCFGELSYQQSIKYGLVRSLGNRADVVKQ